MRQPPPDIAAAAQAAQRATGVFASVTLAQWALESAWGTRCTGKFNFFGIKARAGEEGALCWSHEVIKGVSVAMNERFANFDSVDAAFDAHAQLLTHGRFANAWPLTTPQAFVEAIAPAYATDPAYADKLLELIDEEKFDRFDLQADNPAADRRAKTPA